tara:strand:- start:145 stop:402 length:258 start_codon:yes stop_codon:yes gene_type:complete
MKWFLIIFFTAGHQFVFFTPTFDTVDECMFSASYPPHIAVYGRRLLEEYNTPQEVERVACINEESLKNFLEEDRKYKEMRKGLSL